MMQSLSKKMRDWLVPAGQGEPIRITGQRARDLVDAGAVFVDVRTEAEHASGHIPGSINIPVAQLAGRVDQLGDPDTRIVLYCRSGARSGNGARMLRRLGYHQTYDMGPIGAWPGRR